MTEIACTDVPPLRPFVHWQDGTFEIKGVPAGTKVNLVVWHEGTGFNEGGERGKEITLKEGDNDLGTIKIKSK